MTVVYTNPTAQTAVAQIPRTVGAYRNKPTDQALVATLTAETTTAGTNSPDQSNVGYRGIRAFINISAISGAGATLIVNLQEKDTVSGQYVTRLASAGLTATDNTVLTIYPGIAVTTNLSANDIVGPTWRVQYTISGTTPSVTATINVETLD